jgi:LPXTG-motif cell wall-anchored protein
VEAGNKLAEWNKKKREEMKEEKLRIARLVEKKEIEYDRGGDNNLYWLGGAGGLVVLLVGGWYFTFRKDTASVTPTKVEQITTKEPAVILDME